MMIMSFQLKELIKILQVQHYHAVPHSFSTRSWPLSNYFLVSKTQAKAANRKTKIDDYSQGRKASFLFFAQMQADLKALTNTKQTIYSLLCESSKQMLRELSREPQMKTLPLKVGSGLVIFQLKQRKVLIPPTRDPMKSNEPTYFLTSANISCLNFCQLLIFLTLYSKKGIMCRMIQNLKPFPIERVTLQKTWQAHEVSQWRCLHLMPGSIIMGRVLTSYIQRYIISYSFGLSYI